MNVKQTIPAAALLLILVGSFSEKTQAKSLVDSVGIDRKGDKVYVLHKVEPKQTLFSILKRYGSNLTEYRTENPNIDEAVKTDQIIRVPFHGKMVERKVAVSPKPEPATPGPVVSENGVHHVVGKEGLYGLSLRYKVTMAEVRKWNGLTQDALHEGQVLIMSEAAYERSKKTGVQPSNPAPTPAPTPAPHKPEPEKETPKPELPKPLPKPIEPEKVPEKVVEKEEPKVVTPSPAAKNVVEKGIAEVIDVEDNSSIFGFTPFGSDWHDDYSKK
jgi:LysM repeat protein